MIIKGHSSSGRGLGAYLQGDKNDRVELWGIRGDIPRDLSETLNDWRSDALTTQCEKPLYHAQLNPDRVLSREEWDKALEIFEQEMGLADQPRAVVLHEYKGREHLHVVYSRIDEDGKAISDSWNYLHHEKAAREIERELGLEKTEGVFIDRAGPRPERTPSQAEIQQGERLDIDPKAIKADVSELYRSADSGAAFVAALEDSGYTLAQGDSRAYVILDPAGGVHSLSRMAGVKVGELRETLSDCPLEALPSVAQARDAQQERAQAREPTAPEIEQTAQQTEAAPQIEQAPTLTALEAGSREEGREAVPAQEATAGSAAEIDRATPDRYEAATAHAPDFAPDMSDTLERGLGGAADAGLKVMGKALDGFASSFESLFDGPPPPPTQEQTAQAQAQGAQADDREARIAAAAERIRQANEDYQRQQQEQDRANDLRHGEEFELYRRR